MQFILTSIVGLLMIFGDEFFIRKVFPSNKIVYFLILSFRDPKSLKLDHPVKAQNYEI